jgi:hypothetical protein
MSISNDERLNLKKLVDQSDCDNNTEQIRKLKHSNMIANDINRFIQLKNGQNSENKSQEEFLRSMQSPSLPRASPWEATDGIDRINDASRREDSFIEKCKLECVFLYNHYTDIFNKLVKDELDITIMTKLLVILKMIEDQKVDQHEGSVLVGKLLKELYVDSALKRCDNLDKEHANEKEEKKEGINMSWKEFKQVKK